MTHKFHQNKFLRIYPKILTEKSENITHQTNEDCFFFSDIAEAIDGTDAVVILTEWTEYSKINWSEVCKTMRKPSWIFDTRSSISDNTLRTIEKFDLNIWRIGDGSEHNFK